MIGSIFAVIKDCLGDTKTEIVFGAFFIAFALQNYLVVCVIHNALCRFLRASQTVSAGPFRSIYVAINVQISAADFDTWGNERST